MIKAAVKQGAKVRQISGMECGNRTKGKENSKKKEGTNIACIGDSGYGTRPSKSKYLEEADLHPPPSEPRPNHPVPQPPYLAWGEEIGGRYSTMFK